MGVHAATGRGDSPTLAPLFSGTGCLPGDEMARRRIQRTVAPAAVGDRDAFCELYRHHAASVYRQIRVVVRDEHESQDITQLVFVRLIAALGSSYDARQGAFGPWLLRVARNLAIDHVRRRRVIPAERPRIAERASDAGDGERVAALHDALARLSADQREVLVLRQIVGLRPSEIASRLDRSEGSVHALHHRARAAMRASLTHSRAAPATRAVASASTCPNAAAGGR